MKIGKYTIKIVHSGYFSLDGGAMFGIIPKTLWAKTNPPDDLNRIPLATRNLLLETENKKILIDTGMGNKWDEKSKKIFSIDQKENSINSSLSQLGMAPTDITDVILTHLHFDHTGGSTVEENGKLIPAFPNAKHYVQKKNFEWAMNPSDRDKGSYLRENFEPLADNGILFFIEGEKKFDENIEFILVNGHTFSQQLIKISDSSSTFLYCCDLFPTTSHIPLPYIMGYDLQPLVTLEEKKKILKKAFEEEWKLFFEHDPRTVYATVKHTDKGFRIDQKFESL